MNQQQPEPPEPVPPAPGPEPQPGPEPEPLPEPKPEPQPQPEPEPTPGPEGNPAAEEKEKESEKAKPAAAGKTYRIEYDREACIGAAACAAVAPELFVMVEDGKADLISSEKKHENKLQLKVIKEDQFTLAMEAAESCPVNAIHVIDEETDERLI